MASSWGTSWLTSWADSWGTAAVTYGQLGAVIPGTSAVSAMAIGLGTIQMAATIGGTGAMYANPDQASILLWGGHRGRFIRTPVEFKVNWRAA